MSFLTYYTNALNLQDNNIKRDKESDLSMKGKKIT